MGIRMERTRELNASGWCRQERGASDEVGKGREVDGRTTQRYTRDGRNKYTRVLSCSWFVDANVCAEITLAKTALSSCNHTLVSVLD